jgi:triosephosphate isomerase
MQRPFWIGTGWKMNKTIAQTVDYLGRFRPGADAEWLNLFVIPPFTALAAARAAIGAGPLLLGAQTMHWARSGAHTGEISAEMLVDVGVDLVEIGHSERRAEHGETDLSVAAKVGAAVAAGLRPLVCVGDSAEEFAADASIEAVVRQTKLAFAGLAPADLSGALVAYEPIWAIGESGRVAEPAHIARVLAALRHALDKRGLADVALLYGGSVDAANAGVIAGLREVDGLFVGRAAWTPEGFVEVIQAAVAGRRCAGAF